MSLLINISAFVILTLLWLGFGAAILTRRSTLDRGWDTFRRLPLLAQLALALLALPLVLGLWVWQTDWPAWLRLIVVIGLSWVTLYTFFPKKTAAQAQGSSVGA
jgi:hypothetical protein